MANIIDYLNWRGDIPFSQVPLNEIDSLILSRISYFPFDNLFQGEEQITIENAYKRFKKEKDKIVLQIDDLDLFPMVAKCARYKDLILLDYINKIELKEQKQFSAITICLPNNILYVSFRGTDNTLIGWKEDFNMSFSSHVPSQKDSRVYLDNIASKYKGDIIVGGHSKGGNLAVYSSAFCNSETKKRIKVIYNEDGPGFDEDIIQTTEYQEIIKKVHTYIPQSSIIGRLLNHQETYTVVQSTANGIMQHDLYSWQVLGSKFVSMKNVTDKSLLVDKTIKEWVKTVPAGQREQVVEALFEIINSTEATTLEELSNKKIATARILIKNYQNIDNENKILISRALHSLLGIIKENIMTNISNKNSKKSKKIKSSKLEIKI
ncbi:MAG: DUF2974 domain-containing protein [Clostridia bacterium]|nr:DUF2974 domain-containing protein [Clostridia bacterium]